MSRSGTNRNSNSADRRTVSFKLGEGEVGNYDYIIKELGTSLSYLMRLAIKLMIMLYRHYKQGGQFILRDKDGKEHELYILEFQGAKLNNQGGENAQGDRRFDSFGG